MFRIKNYLKVAIIATLLLPNVAYALKSDLEADTETNSQMQTETPPEAENLSEGPEMAESDEIVSGRNEPQFMYSVMFSMNEERSALTIKTPKEIVSFSLYDTNHVEYLRVEDATEGESTYSLNKPLGKDVRYFIQLQSKGTDDESDIVNHILMDTEQGGIDSKDNERLYHIEIGVERFQSINKERLVYEITYADKTYTKQESFNINGLASIKPGSDNIKVIDGHNTVSLKIRPIINYMTIPEDIAVYQSDIANEHTKELIPSSDNVYEFNINDGTLIMIKQKFTNSYSIEEREKAIENGRLNGDIINSNSLEKEGEVKDMNSSPINDINQGDSTKVDKEQSDAIESNSLYMYLMFGSLVAISLVGWLVINKIQKGKRK